MAKKKNQKPKQPIEYRVELSAGPDNPVLREAALRGIAEWLQRLMDKP